MSGSPDRGTALRRAEAALDLGRPAEALDLARGLLASDPHDTDALLVVARAHVRLGDARAQLDAANAALAQDHHLVEALLYAGDAACRLGDRRTGLLRLRTAVELAPDAWATHGIHAQHLAADRRHGQQAWEEALRAVELAPDRSETHEFAGRVALQRGDLRTAERAYRRALEIDPQNAEALNDLSLVLARTGRGREAAAGFGATLALDPQQDIARTNLDWLVTKTIQRLHYALLIGLFVVLRVLAADSLTGRIVAFAVAALTVGIAAWTVWRNHHGLPSSVIGFARTFPRRQPLRAGWGACCLAGFVALLACAVVPSPGDVVAVGIGYVFLFVGCALSWLALLVDRHRTRRARRG